MTIQTMMMAGRLLPTFINSDSYTASSDNNLFLTVPSGTQEGDLLVFVASYEWDNNRYWIGDSGGKFTKIFDPYDGVTNTNGPTIWTKIADADDQAGAGSSQYNFFLNGNRKTSATLFTVRNASRIRSYHYTNTSAIGTSMTISGPNTDFYSYIHVAYFTARNASENWTLQSPYNANYTNILRDTDSAQPSTLLVYRENLSQSPATDITANYGGSTVDDGSGLAFTIE